MPSTYMKKRMLFHEFERMFMVNKMNKIEMFSISMFYIKILKKQSTHSFKLII